MLNTHIEAEASKLLQQADVVALPINVESIARYLGLTVEATQLGDNVSGLLVLDKDRGSIGYNKDQSTVRQRFTIAHEIGHFVLHRNTQSLFIDKKYNSGVYQRNERSSTGEDPQEVQANRFAAALLMPRSLVVAEVANSEFDLGDERGLSELAHKFRVSTQAMAFRLANLGLLSSGDAI